jgi:hypothetical protein
MSIITRSFTWPEKYLTGRACRMLVPMPYCLGHIDVVPPHLQPARQNGYEHHVGPLQCHDPSMVDSTVAG